MLERLQVDVLELILGLELVLVGMGITFLVLIVLATTLTIIGKIVTKQEGKNNKLPKAETDELKIEETIIEENEDEETIAMIAAAYLHCFKNEIPMIYLSETAEKWKYGRRRDMMEGL